MKDVLRVAIYARCSTMDQTTDLQVDTLREYAHRRGFVVHQIFSDNGISGAKASRPELNKMMDLVKKRRVDAVLVYKLDRLGRSLRNLLGLVQQMQEINVALISYSENIDLTTSAGKMMFAMIAALSEFERDLIRERVTAGVRRAIQKRGSWGKKAKEYDLNSVAGLSNRAAAQQLGVSHELVRRLRSRDAHKTDALQ